MSDSTASQPEPSPADRNRGRIDRTVIGVNVAIQLVLVFVIVVIANYISFRQYKRWDLSHNNNYALSSKTKNLLAHLDEPVRATVFFPQAQMLTKDVAGLLREYEFAAKGKKFIVEYVDPYKNLTRARELQEKFKFGTSDNIVIVEYKGKNKYVNAADMAEFDNSGAMFGQPPTMRAFKGEEAITSAIQELTDEKQNKLYLLTGHGEPELKEGGANAFKAYMDRENIKLDMLNLNNVDAIPADATGLMVFGPKTDLSEREIFMLDAFWKEKKGRLFILLNPAGKQARLSEWLSQQGVTPQGDRVLKTGTVFVLGENNQPTVKSGLITSPTAKFAEEGRRIVKDLAGTDTQLFGATESLVLDRSRTQTQKVKFTTLLESGEGFWGETEYVQGENRNTFFDPKKDHMGPLVVGVALEKGALEDARVTVDTARMLVVGNSGFLTDEGLRVSEAGLDFALLSVGWMFNREQIAGIPPKPKKALSLDLKDEQIARIFYSTVVAIPLSMAIFGLFVTWHRRNRNLLELLAWVLGAAMFITGVIWCLNLWITSHEAGTTAVNIRSFAIPAALVVVALLALLMKMLRTSASSVATPQNA